MGRHYDHRDMGVMQADTLQQGQTIGPRHADIRDYDLGLGDFQRLPQRLGGGKAGTAEFGALQCPFQHPTN